MTKTLSEIREAKLQLEESFKQQIDKFEKENSVQIIDIRFYADGGENLLNAETRRLMNLNLIINF